MAGNFTDRRVSPSYKGPFRWSLGIGDTPASSGALQIGGPPTQATTSYRSRTGTTDEESGDLPTNQLEAFKRFKKEGRRNRKTPGSRPGWDTGHPFTSVHQEVILGVPRCTLYGASNSDYRYEGPLVPSTIPNGLTATYPELPGWNPDYYGTKAISETIPTNPVADLAVFLAELRREGIPQRPGNQAIKRDGPLSSQGLGGEYLNFEFGWKPVISEVRNVSQSVLNANKHIRQLARDSGKLIRRRHAFPLIEESTVQTGRGYVYNVPGQTSFEQQFFAGGVTRTTLRTTTTLSQKIWFSGAYSYLLPNAETIVGKISRFESQANHLLGLRLTPEVLWELAPWSWLSDWNMNVGDILSNASALGKDGLVIRYGYLMRTTVAERTLQLDPLPLSRGGVSPTATLTLRTTRKERIAATPYGFGLNPSTFSLRQWAILGALGMTKAPEILPG